MEFYLVLFIDAIIIEATQRINMFRTLGKSKIAFVLAILFGISLFFFKSGSRYSNILNSDNVVATVSGTNISTSKYNRTLQMNINQFNQMLNKKIGKEEIKNFQLHTLSLSALINNAVFESEFNKLGFKLDETVIAQKTKEKIPRLYDDKNKLNEIYLNQFLQQQQLKIEDIVQIIDYETRDIFFEDAFFKIDYPKNFSNKINEYKKHLRKIKYLKISLNEIDIADYIEKYSSNIDENLKKFYDENISFYMTDEKRDVDFIRLNKKNYSELFEPTESEILEYYNKNKKLYSEKEKRSFIQFNFKTAEEAKKLKFQINDLNDNKDIIVFANENNININIFDDLTSNEVQEQIAKSLFNLKTNQISEVIKTDLAYHIIVLQNITEAFQKSYKSSKEDIKEIINSIELNNYFIELNNDISETIVKGYTLKEIESEFDLKIESIENITKELDGKKNGDEEYLESLITNSFASNKDFVSDIIAINSDNFYIFNVSKIIISTPNKFEKVKKFVKKDWEFSLKKQKLNDFFNSNINNNEIIEKTSKEFNISFEIINLDQQSSELPKSLVMNIFQSSKEDNLKDIDKENYYIAKLIDIVLPKEISSYENISLSNDLKSAFGKELFKKKKISTNENLINAIINRY